MFWILYVPQSGDGKVIGRAVALDYAAARLCATWPIFKRAASPQKNVRGGRAREVWSKAHQPTRPYRIYDFTHDPRIPVWQEWAMPSYQLC